MFVVKKRGGMNKARVVAGGNTHQVYLAKEDSSSPTVATKEVPLTSNIDAHEKRYVAVIDIPNAFIHMWVNDVKDHVIMWIQGVVVDLLVNMAPEYMGYLLPCIRRERRHY